jgi:hypothetical protein
VATSSGESITRLMQALRARDQGQFGEAVREYNQNFGLSQEQFRESIRRLNERLGITQVAPIERTPHAARRRARRRSRT